MTRELVFAERNRLLTSHHRNCRRLIFLLRERANRLVPADGNDRDLLKFYSIRPKVKRRQLITIASTSRADNFPVSRRGKQRGCPGVVSGRNGPNFRPEISSIINSDSIAGRCFCVGTASNCQFACRYLLTNFTNSEQRCSSCYC